MNVTREQLGDLDLSIRIDIEESDYAERVKKQLKSYQQRAQVAGFRKGNAPMGLIQRMYKQSIMANEIQDILSENLYKYIADEKLELLGGPLSNEEKTGAVDFANATSFTFYFDAALAPKINIAWDKVTGSLMQIKLSAKDIDKRVEDIAKRSGKFETPEAIGENDHVYGKVEELDKEKNVKEDGLTTFASFELSQLKDDEARQLFIGKKVGDVVPFNVAKAFTPSEIESVFRMENAAAKKFKSEVQMTISGCSRITPHELNDELFAQVFPGEEFKDAAAFRKRLSKEMEKEFNEQCDMIYVQEVRKQLEDNMTEPIPEQFLKRWLVSRGDKDMTAESVDQQWESSYLPSIKWEIISSKLNEIAPVEPTQNQLTDYVKDILRNSSPKAADENDKAYEDRLEESARSITSHPEQLTQLRSRLSLQNLASIFKGQLKPEVEKVSIKEMTERMK